MGTGEEGLHPDIHTFHISPRPLYRPIIKNNATKTETSGGHKNHIILVIIIIIIIILVPTWSAVCASALNFISFPIFLLLEFGHINIFVTRGNYAEKLI